MPPPYADPDLPEHGQQLERGHPAIGKERYFGIRSHHQATKRRYRNTEQSAAAVFTTAW